VRDADRSASALQVPEWIREVRDLFPADTCEVITRHALERYGLSELVTDPETLQKMQPSYDLLKAVLSFRGLLKGAVLPVARALVKKVVDDLTKKLEPQLRRALSGKLSRRTRTRLKSARALDVAETVRKNLKNWDPARKQLVVSDLRFLSRVQRHLPWHFIFAVDCSGSMIDSVIHSAVMAGIFRRLPSVKTSLIAFDTACVDLTEAADDPVEVLMSVQLGGGTNIGGALAHCATLVTVPTRTALVFVTDFCEGGSAAPMLSVRLLFSEQLLEQPPRRPRVPFDERREHLRHALPWDNWTAAFFQVRIGSGGEVDDRVRFTLRCRQIPIGADCFRSLRPRSIPGASTFFLLQFLKTGGTCPKNCPTLRGRLSWFRALGRRVVALGSTRAGQCKALL
jgi:hypothetical protein